MALEFLTVEDVLYIHQNQIDQYGGEHGVREEGLLASAYLFPIAQNHPFLDGNKRTGAAAALTFLDWNGIELQDDSDGLVELVLQVATGQADKEVVAEFFRSRVIGP